MDYELIRSIVTHPKIYPFISDDFSPPREEFKPVEHASIWYVLVRDGEELLGAFAFMPANSVCLEVHTFLTPNAWGSRAEEAGHGVILWMWQNSPCRRIITNVPKWNTLALRFALRAGLEQFGINELSYMKHGTLHDQILLGISKPQE